MKKIWDISPPVNQSSPVFPGDTKYEQSWVTRIANGDAVNVSRLTMTSHMGAHADAPLHYDDQGLPIGAVHLSPFLGRCRVIDARRAGVQIELKDISHAVKNIPRRVLIRGYQKFPLVEFDSQAKSLTPQLVEALAQRGVELVGTDSASIDPCESHAMLAHQVLRRNNMRVLENLYLDDVSEGDYELIALPLRLMNAESSPVRAVLREI